MPNKICVCSINSVDLDNFVKSSERKSREKVAIHPDLTNKQMKELFFDYKSSCKYKIKSHIKNGILTEQQIQLYFSSDIKEIQCAMCMRYKNIDELNKLSEKLTLMYIRVCI